MVNTGQYIPSSQVIAIAKQNLQLSTDNFDNFFDLAIENKLTNLNAPSVYQKNLSKVVEICDNSFISPKGAIVLWSILLCSNIDRDTNQLVYNNQSLFAVNSMIYGKIVGRNGFGVSGTINQFAQQQNGVWYFNNPTDELYVQVWYEGYEIDEDGNILIPSSYQYGLAEHCCDVFLRSNPKYYGDFNTTRTLMLEYRKSSNAKMLQALGRDRLNEFQEQKPLLRFAQNKIRMAGSYFDNYYFI